MKHSKKCFSHSEILEKVLFALWNTRESAFRTTNYSKKSFSHSEILEKVFFTLWNNRRSVFRTQKNVFHIVKQSKKCFSHSETLEKVHFALWNTRRSAFHIVKQAKNVRKSFSIVFSRYPKPFRLRFLHTPSTHLPEAKVFWVFWHFEREPYHTFEIHFKALYL